MTSMRDFAKDRQICEAATRGPWFAYIHRDDSAEIATEAGGVSSWICQTWYKDEDVMPNSSNNARFIAAAREGWPSALDEIERLQNRYGRLVAAELRYVQEIEQLRAELDSHESWKAVNEATSRELQSAQQEIERLRKAFAIIEEEMADDTSQRAQCINRTIREALSGTTQPKETGIVRRLDDLGRVVIPKVVRAEMSVQEGDPLEILLDGDRAVLRRYVHRYVPYEEQEQA